MKIDVVQRNYVAKEKLTDLIEKKVSKFEKYLDAGANAKVVLSKSGSQERYKMEVSIKDKKTNNEVKYYRNPNGFLYQLMYCLD